MDYSRILPPTTNHIFLLYLHSISQMSSRGRGNTGRGGRSGRGGGRGQKRRNTFGSGGSRDRSKKRVKKAPPPPKLSSNGEPEEVTARRFVYDQAGHATEIPRCPKHKWALQFGYCGTGYCGLQIQDHVMTLERELATALFRSGAIFDTNLTKINRIGWSRAARTDKGVHAASNLIVAKLMVQDGGANGELEKFLALVNLHLPNEMKIFSAHRVTKKFDARWRCERRFYEYLMPTFMFSPNLIADLQYC